MGDLLPYLVVVGALAAVMAFFAWLASVVRRRGVAGAGMRAAMASWEEAFKVTSHESHYEIQAKAERKSPLLSPGDRWKPRGPRGPRRRSGRPGRGR